MRGVANISYSMTLILRPGDNDPDIGYGFTLPEPSKTFLTFIYGFCFLGMIQFSIRKEFP